MFSTLTCGGSSDWYMFAYLSLSSVPLIPQWQFVLIYGIEKSYSFDTLAFAFSVIRSVAGDLAAYSPCQKDETSKQIAKVASEKFQV